MSDADVPTEIEPVDGIEGVDDPDTGHARTTTVRRKMSPFEIFLVVFGVLLVATAIFGSFLPLPDPTQQSLRERLQPPVGFGGGWDHPLGTDALGRDMLSLLVAGTRLTVLIAALSVLVGATVGCGLGLIAGFRRGWVDAVITRLTEAQMALPFLLLAIAIITNRGRSITTLVIVLSIVGWTQYVRIVRADTMAIRERPFIQGLRIGGASDTRIVLRHILPNVAGTIVALATLEVGTMILAESALSFLGLGVVSPDISWGGLLADGRDNLRDAWWVVTLPGLAIVVVVLYVNLAGDALRSRYDLRKRDH